MAVERKRSQSILRINSEYKNVFSTPAGKNVLNDLMSRCNVLDDISDNDPISSARKEGRRSVVLHILKVLKSDLKAIEKAFEDREEKIKLNLEV